MAASLALVTGALALVTESLLQRPAFAVNGLAAGTGSARDFGDTASIPLFVSLDEAAQGLVMVFQWDGRKGVGEDLRVDNDVGQIFEGADFIQSRVEADYMVLAIITDLVGDGMPLIPAGQDQEVGSADIMCVCRGPRQEVAVALVHRSFRSLVPGGQILDNMVIIGGESVLMADGLELTNGTLICNSEDEPPPVDSPEVTCGDVDGNGDLVTVEGQAGQNANLCFLYRAPVSDDPRERIQGLQLSVSYDCNLECDENTLSTAGGVLEDVVPDFLDVDCDNVPADDPGDDDDCELIAGILVDAMPPFDGATLPGTAVHRRLFCLEFAISASAPCGSDLPVAFVNGLDGTGIVPIPNVAAINNQDVPLDVTACSVRVAGDAAPANFVRGDCNFDGTVNVVDASSMVAHIFLVGDARFDPPCLDACDSDDSGKLDITDPIFILNWLFVRTSPPPPLPGGVTPGADGTPDDPLDCVAGQGDVPCL